MIDCDNFNHFFSLLLLLLLLLWLLFCYDYLFSSWSVLSFSIRHWSYRRQRLKWSWLHFVFGLYLELMKILWGSLTQLLLSIDPAAVLLFLTDRILWRCHCGCPPELEKVLVSLVKVERLRVVWVSWVNWDNWESVTWLVPSSTGSSRIVASSFA